MGLSSRLSLHARHRDGAHRVDDRGEAPAVQRRGRGRAHTRLAAVAALALCAASAHAEPLRIATYNVELSRDGPGLLLADLVAGDARDIAAAVADIAAIDPDVLLVTDFDHDEELRALTAFADRLATVGSAYPHLFSLPPNRGLLFGEDRNADRRVALPDDAHGYAAYRGAAGMALLSRIPVVAHRDLSGLLWRDLPDALLTGAETSAPATAKLRLSTTGHWIVYLGHAGAPEFALLAFYATPPVFDGPDDLNGRRNHDETALWHHVIDGRLGDWPRDLPFVIAGDVNLDPEDGDGRPEALWRLLADPRVIDPMPSSAGAVAASARDGGANRVQSGDPALDTADWNDGPGGPGNLRVDYVLPSAHWRILGAGVHWPPDAAPAVRGPGDARTRSRHRLVWVDVTPNAGPGN